MIRIENVAFSYGEENEKNNGIRNINLHIKKGEFVVFCGESGCGKTTLTRLINGLIPHYYEGHLTGNVFVDGKNVSEQPIYETAKKVGSVFQNPRSQFFNVDTTSEITFGCENLGMPEEIIRKRLKETVENFQMEHLMNRNIFHLSGGEKQKIACAGVSIMEPDIFVLDEPSSNLDASSIHKLREILSYWKTQGKTIIISEHRLYYLRGLADRFIYMENGTITQEYSAEQFEQITEEQREEMGLRTFKLENISVLGKISGEKQGESQLSELGVQAKTQSEAQSVKIELESQSVELDLQRKTQGESQLSELSVQASIQRETPSKKLLETSKKKLPVRHNKEQNMQLKDFCFSYKNSHTKDRKNILNIKECSIPVNGIIGIIGNNGAGKSTFSRCFCGLEKRCGEIIWNGKKYRSKDRLNSCYMVMQEVNHQLFTETVLDEILISMAKPDEKQAEELLSKLDLLEVKDRHPMSLSGGQKQRVAIASAIASKRSILFFDEPTSGLDYKHMKQVAELLRKLQKEGITLYIITHDLELILECCTDILHLENGSVKEQYPVNGTNMERIAQYFRNF